MIFKLRLKEGENQLSDIGHEDISDRGSSKVSALSRAGTMSYERWCRREQQGPSPEAQEWDFVLRGH